MSDAAFKFAFFLLSQMINLWHSLLVNHLLSMQIHRSEIKLWSAFSLAHICMHMNGTKSNVTALTMLKYSFLFATLFMIFSIFLNLVLHFQPYQPDCCLDNCADHWKTHIHWTLLFSNSHKHLRNCGRLINLSPSPHGAFISDLYLLRLIAA